VYSKRASTLVRNEKSTFGIINTADAYATEIDLGFQESSFYYRQKDLIFKAKTKLSGAFNVYNTLAALRCVIDLGIKPCIAKKALLKIDRIDGRMEVIPGDITFIIDYAHTPEAFCNSLKTIKQVINKRQKLIVVFGCGGNRDRQKRPIFGRYAEELADKVIITEDNSRNEDFDLIATDITSGMSAAKHEIIRDRREAIRHAYACAHPGDTVALIGKGHERYKIQNNEYIPFDERQIIKELLEETDEVYAYKA
jgi:UDP-N-acetylmuramoyl-L-alanyl-D-glutamate--2,6-diaminopimelate ligase